MTCVLYMESDIFWIPWNTNNQFAALWEHFLFNLPEKEVQYLEQYILKLEPGFFGSASKFTYQKSPKKNGAKPKNTNTTDFEYCDCSYCQDIDQNFPKESDKIFWHVCTAFIDKEIDMSDLNLSGLRRITDNFLFVYIENKNTWPWPKSCAHP